MIKVYIDKKLFSLFIGFHTYSGHNTLIMLFVGTIYCEAASTFLYQYAYQHTHQKSHICLCVVYFNFDVFFIRLPGSTFFKKGNTLRY